MESFLCALAAACCISGPGLHAAFLEDSLYIPSWQPVQEQALQLVQVRVLQLVLLPQVQPLASSHLWDAYP